jgi:hypothetical protein
MQDAFGREQKLCTSMVEFLQHPFLEFEENSITFIFYTLSHILSFAFNSVKFLLLCIKICWLPQRNLPHGKIFLPTISLKSFFV